MNEADHLNRKKKGKFVTLSSQRSSEPKAKVALYPWDDGNPEWEDLNDDVDETVARDIDQMNGDIVNLAEITEGERDRQMQRNIRNARRDNYLRAACVHWKKVCATYREKAKSLKKKLSLLNRHGVDQNGGFAPNKLCSRFSRRMRLVSCFAVVDVVVCTNDCLEA